MALHQALGVAHVGEVGLLAMTTLGGRLGLRRLPLGGLRGQLLQLLGGPAGVHPVAKVPTVLRDAGQLDDLHASCLPVETLRHLAGVPASGLVVVREDPHVRARQRLREVIAPLLGAHRARRGREPDPLKPVDVLLPLGHPHRASLANGRQHLRQPVEDGPRAVPEDALVHPPPGPVGLALGEALRLVAEGLKQEIAGLVGVAVGFDRLLPVAVRLVDVPSGLLKEVAYREPHRAYDLCLAASDVAIQQDAPIVAQADAEARLQVAPALTVVRYRAGSLEASVLLPHVLEALENPVERPPLRYLGM